jgi:hypothetical protein
VSATIVSEASELSIAASCRVLGLARATDYRSLESRPAGETSLRDLVQQVALEWPAYDYRRITAELNRRGHAVNRKCVQQVAHLFDDSRRHRGIDRLQLFITAS